MASHGPDGTRTLAALAVCILALPLVVPRASLPSVLAAATAAAAVYALLFGGAGIHWGDSDSEGPQKHPRDGKRDSKRHGLSSGHVLPPFAPIDSELYTLRVPLSPELVLQRRPRQALKHLALHGDLIDRVLRAARLGARNGNSGSGSRALASLEDFFARYHRALVSRDPALASRTLETLRDTRVVALNALTDLTMTVPLALGGPIEAAIERARSETLRCMGVLAARHAPSGSPALRSAAWSTPLPHDPARALPNVLW
jgi:hypothetical protein